MADAPARVRLMMAMTADGKIATVAREAARFGGVEDERRLKEQVARADALIMAAGTLRAYGTTFLVREDAHVAGRRERGQRPQPVSAIVSRSLDLPPDLPFFRSDDLPRLIATVERNGAAARRKFGTVAEVFAAGRDEVDLSALIAHLAETGRPSILALGGGTLNYSLVRDGLVDEVYLTISPRFFGGAAAPTVIDGPGFSLDEAPRLSLRSIERVGDDVFLRYDVMKDS